MVKKKKNLGYSDKVRLAQLRKNSTNQLKSIQNNPFEIKINRQKHNILGRKLKHDRGLPGVSRSKSNKKRKETLLHEYKQMFKSNKIKDSRLGVNDKNMSLEEKMLQRFTLEKRRKHERMAQFNLNDDEELTHLGQSLSTIENFDDIIESDDDDNGNIPGDYTESSHFSGGMFKKTTPGDITDPTKSKKEIIDEIIAKSKFAKKEKQHEKDDADQLLIKADEKWKDVRDLIRPTFRSAQDDIYTSKNIDSTPDDFDVLMVSMKYDRKAVPREKKKNPEEINKEKEAAILKQEKERLARMEIQLDLKKKEYESADALIVEFEQEKKENNVPVLSYPLIDESTNGDESENQEVLDDIDTIEDEEKESEIADQGIVDDGASLEDDEQDEESDDFSDIDSGNEDDADLLSLEEEPEVVHSVKSSDTPNENKSSSNFPASYADFTALLVSGISPAVLTTKLRKEYAPDLRKGNKAKLIELFAYVWEHTCRMASISPPNMTVIGSLCSHLFELCRLNLDSCTLCVIERLKRSYHYCFLTGKTTRSKWPKFEMLIQFKMIKSFYSTSDYSHIVATRSLAFMCNILNNCRVTSYRELACGIFLCTLAYEYVSFSKRYLPECLNFLVSCLSMSIPSEKKQKLCLPPVVSLHLDKINSNFLVLDSGFSTEVVKDKLNLVQLLDDEAQPEDSSELRFLFLLTTLRLCKKFSTLYIDLPAYDDVFSPVKYVCNLILNDSALSNHDVLIKHTQELIAIISDRSNLPRMRLSTGPKRPTPLKMFNPKLEEIGEPFDKRRRNISAEKRQKNRLLHKRQRELKGAVREIRKDTKFLSRIKQKEMEKKDADRQAKVKRLYGILSNQEGEVKKTKRSKYKLDV